MAKCGCALFVVIITTYFGTFCSVKRLLYTSYNNYCCDILRSGLGAVDSSQQTPADVKLPDIVNFLRGNGTLTSWVDPGVANELGVASVIGDVWKTGRSNLTDFVIRRLV